MVIGQSERNQVARFVADRNGLQPVRGLELSDQLNHLGKGFDCSNLKRRN